MPHRLLPPVPDDPIDDAVLAEKVTLQAVIVKIKGIAANHYDDKIYDNILPIFNHLNKDEKRVFLRGLSNILFIVEDKILFDKQELESIRAGIETTKQNIDNEIRVIQQTNELELIKLKSWGVKAFAIFLVVAVATVAGIWTLFGGERLNAFASLVKIKKVFFEIIGL